MYGIFTVYPIFRQFDISFFQWHIFPRATNPFVGWSNYSEIFHDPAIPTAALNSLLYIVITVPLQMAIGLFAAAVLSDRLPGGAFFRAAVYVPVITSWVVVSWVFGYIFNAQDGLMNAFLSVFAGHSVRIDWLAQTWTGNAVIWLVGIWKGVGWSFLIFLAALDQVPREALEAARVDGASERRVWWNVIIPSMRAATAFVTVMLVIGAATVFQQIYILTSGGPFNSTQVLYTYAYQETFKFFACGYGAAIGSLIAAVLLVMSAVELRVIRRQGESGARL
jgi:multiple sugar transport system permease protein